MYKKKQRRQTEAALQEALLHLLQEAELNELSITQLVKVAGVSRMSFYRIYDSLPDLFYALLDQVFYDLLELATPFLLAGDWEAFWTALFNFMYEEQAVVSILLKSKDYTTLLNYMNEAFIDEEATIDEQYYLAAMIGLAFNLLMTWAHHDYDKDPASLAKLASTFSLSAMEEVAKADSVENYMRKRKMEVERNKE